MKNVPFGQMCRVEHHVLALVHPTLARCLAGMAICAPDFALGDFLKDCGPGPTR
jgi:hypothetical protein